MLKRNLALTILILSSCGKAPIHSQELVPYIQQFDTQYSLNTSGIDIEIVDKISVNVEVPVNQVILGVCLGDHIQIAGKYWPLLSETSKKSVIYHELGHCVFKRIHTTDTYSDGCPTSIMNTSLLSDTCVESHRGQLLTELPLSAH